MKTIMMSCLLALSLVACSKKGKPSCEEIYEHTKSLAPAEMRELMDQKKDSAIEKCGKMSDEAKQCAMDAKTMADLQKCPRA